MSIIESIEAILAEGPNFNIDDGIDNILIVEGKDDIEVIEKHYFLKKNKDMPFRICVGEDFGEHVSGKKNAIKSLEKHINEYPKIICLLDRDLDFQLGLNEDNERILYYDYYELENYLFEDSILKVFLGRFYKFTDNESYLNILDSFYRISKYYTPIAKMMLAREICNRDAIFDDKSKFDKIAKLSKKDLGPILSHKSQVYEGLDFLDKIYHYINQELSEVDLDLSYLEGLFEDNEAAATLISTEDFSGNIFKYAIGAKQVIKSIQILMQEFIDSQYIKEGGQISLERSLKKEWIPIQSEKFADLMDYIENKF